MKYFVDTNIIISYIWHVNQHLVAFIENKQNHFYYTETVKSELVGTTIPAVFKFINSNIEDTRKHYLYKEIVETTNLSAIQERRFKNDIYIIFECGYMCVDVMDTFYEPIPRLLTNNLKLYRKFIEGSGEEKLEDCINKHGFEHMPELVYPKDVIIGFTGSL